VARSAIKQRVEAALELVHMADFANRPVPRLSGGQQQRVALARALVREPPLLLLDEPLSNLDAKLRVEMRDELVSVARSTGVAVIYVTHDQVEALAMSDRIVVMNSGNIAQQGSPAEIYTAPRSAFVAQFMGESNRLAGTVAEVGTGDRVVVSSAIGPVHCRVTEPVAAGAEVVVFTHLEDVTLSVGTPASATNVYAAELERVVYLGDRMVATLTRDGEELQATARAHGGLTAGQAVNVHIDPDQSVAVPAQ
jgi:iron(III) transport system ATP-binding protein